MDDSDSSDTGRSFRWLVACLYSPRADIGVGAAFRSLDAAAEVLAVKPLKTELIFKDEGKGRHPLWRKFKILAEEQPLREVVGAGFYPSERKFHEIGYSEYVVGIQVGKCTSAVAAIPTTNLRNVACDNIFKTVAGCFSPLQPIKYGFLTYLTPAINPVSFATGFMHITNKLRFERSNERFQHSSDVSMRRMGRHYIEFARDLDGPQTALQHRHRDVYESNLLSEGHLNATVNGVTFRNWVSQTSLGTLDEISDGLWVWDVPNERADEARRALRENGLLIAPD